MRRRRSVRILTNGLTFALIAGVFWALYIRSSAKVGASGSGCERSGGCDACWCRIHCPGGKGCSGSSADVECGAHPMLLLMIFGTAMFASVILYSAGADGSAHLPERVFSVLMSGREPAIGGDCRLGAAESGETGPVHWMAIFLLMTASVGITLTTTKGRSHKQKDAAGEDRPSATRVKPKSSRVKPKS